nr:lamin-like protein [Tanacetum cinerariifolium]
MDPNLAVAIIDETFMYNFYLPAIVTLTHHHSMMSIISFLLLILATTVSATDHIVGANRGWNPGLNYTLWANNHTFYVGDFISFRYQKFQYNVVEVNKTGYDNCTLDSAVGNWSSGKDFILLNKSQRYYFICGTGGCMNGMKVAIRVHPLPSPPAATTALPSTSAAVGAAKVSHFKINCRVLNIIPTLSLFRVFYTPSFNSGWMSFSKRLGKNTLQCYTKPLDSLKNWNNRFFWVDERVFPTVVDWRTSAPKDGMPTENMYSSEAVRILDTHRTPIQKQPEALLCLVGLSHRYYLGDKVYNYWHLIANMDLFSLIRAPNPTKVKTGSRSRAAHEVPLLTMTATRVIEVEDPAAATDMSGVPSTIKRYPLDFANEARPEDQGVLFALEKK